jgi:hypothetical protein
MRTPGISGNWLVFLFLEDQEIPTRAEICAPTHPQQRLTALQPKEPPLEPHQVSSASLRARTVLRRTISPWWGFKRQNGNFGDCQSDAPISGNDRPHSNTFFGPDAVGFKGEKRPRKTIAEQLSCRQSGR